MKLNERAVATSAAVLGGIYFIGCYVLVLVAPDVYKNIAQSWAHGVNIDLIWNPMAGNAILGFLSFVGFSAVTGWVFAFLYNKIIK